MPKATKKVVTKSKSVKSAKSVKTVRPAKKVVAGKANTSKLLIVAGIAVVVLGVSYVVARNYGAQSPDIFQVGQPVTPRATVRDSFNDGKINTDKWNVPDRVGVSVKETPADNLNIAVTAAPAGNAQSPLWRAGLVSMKQSIPGGEDFIATTGIYRPIATKTDAGTLDEGISFVAAGKADEEAASVFWRYSKVGTVVKYSLIYSVVGSDGKPVESHALDFAKPRTSLRISRVDSGTGATFKTTYRFWYLDDISDEVNGWKVLGEADVPNLDHEGKGADGNIQLFARTRKQANNAYLPGVARIDGISLSWPKNTTNTVTYFRDVFAGPLNTANWKRGTNPPAETFANGNLFINIPAGANAGKARAGALVLNQAFANDRPVSVVVELLKPTLGGDGLATSGVGFRSMAKDTLDAESASVRWIGNQLAFIITDDKGKEVKRVVRDVPAAAQRIVVRLSRNKDVYRATFMWGAQDGEKAFALLGQESLKQLGSKAEAYLFAGNVGANGKYPEVHAGFDEFAVSFDNNPNN